MCLSTRDTCGASQESPWVLCPFKLPWHPPDTGCHSNLLSALCVATQPHQHKPPHQTFFHGQRVEPVNIAVPHGKGLSVAEVVLVHIWLQFDSETGSDLFPFWGKKRQSRAFWSLCFIQLPYQRLPNSSCHLQVGNESDPIFSGIAISTSDPLLGKIEACGAMTLYISRESEVFSLATRKEVENPIGKKGEWSNSFAGLGIQLGEALLGGLGRYWFQVPFSASSGCQQQMKRYFGLI